MCRTKATLRRKMPRNRRILSSGPLRGGRDVLLEPRQRPGPRILVRLAAGAERVILPLAVVVVVVLELVNDATVRQFVTEPLGVAGSHDLVLLAVKDQGRWQLPRIAING